jgi:hypothetical protein
MPRHSYTIILEITPTAPLTHGAGNAGNEQLLHTTERLLCVDGVWQRLEVPTVSGAALRATLREHAVSYYLEALGVPHGSVHRDALRLLLKGGKVSGGSQTVSLDDARRLRVLVPPLSVWGSMDGTLPVRGRLSVSEVAPYAEELGEPQAAAREMAPGLHAARPPVPLAMAWGRPVTYYRHDLTTSPAAVYLEGPAAAQIEQARTDLATADRPAKKEARREANESMPHSYQCITAGTPMVAVLRLSDVDEVEFACLGLAIARWIAHGGHLGGAAAKGHGACTVRVARAVRIESHGPVPVRLEGADLPARVEDAPGVEAVRDGYHAHLEAVRAEAMAVLGVRA